MVVHVEILFPKKWWIGLISPPNDTLIPTHYNGSTQVHVPLKMKDQANISFSIDPYQDMIRCDVLPISVCHLLLGRPWQFDRQVIHDGYTNEYSFSQKGKKLKLCPLNPHEIMPDHVAREQQQLLKEEEERTTWENHPWRHYQRR